GRAELPRPGMALDPAAPALEELRQRGRDHREGMDHGLRPPGPGRGDERGGGAPRSDQGDTLVRARRLRRANVRREAVAVLACALAGSVGLAGAAPPADVAADPQLRARRDT